MPSATGASAGLPVSNPNHIRSAAAAARSVRPAASESLPPSSGSTRSPFPVALPLLLRSASPPLPHWQSRLPHFEPLPPHSLFPTSALLSTPNSHSAVAVPIRHCALR